MNHLPEDYVKTVRIQRPAKVTTDEHGHTVWTAGVESVELELVSTTSLTKILESGDKIESGLDTQGGLGKRRGSSGKEHDDRILRDHQRCDSE